MNNLIFEWYKIDEQSVNLISCISTDIHLPDNLLNAHILQPHSKLSP